MAKMWLSELHSKYLALIVLEIQIWPTQYLSSAVMMLHYYVFSISVNTEPKQWD